MCVLVCERAGFQQWHTMTAYRVSRTSDCAHREHCQALCKCVSRSYTPLSFRKDEDILVYPSCLPPSESGPGEPTLPIRLGPIFKLVISGSSRISQCQSKVPQICGFLFAKYSNHLQINTWQREGRFPGYPWPPLVDHLSHCGSWLTSLEDGHLPRRQASSRLCVPCAQQSSWHPKVQNILRQRRMEGREGDCGGKWQKRGRTDSRDSRRRRYGCALVLCPRSSPCEQKPEALHHLGEGGLPPVLLTRSPCLVLAGAGCCSFKLDSAGSS